MNRILIILMMAVPGLLCAQGTVDFRNLALEGGVDAPVYNPNTGLNVSGPDIVAQLYYSSSETDIFTPVAYPPAPLRTGAGVGYWNPGDLTRVLDGIAPGETARLQVRVWDSALYGTFEDAEAAGGPRSLSGVFSVLTGGVGSPPSLPAYMQGLQPIPYIPEPGTISLALMGGMVMAFLGWRRKKR